MNAAAAQAPAPFAEQVYALRREGIALTAIARSLHVSRHRVTAALRDRDPVQSRPTCSTCKAPLLLPAERCGFCVAESGGPRP